MKFFAITLCLIPLCFCSGQKRRSPISEQPQDLIATIFLKGAFKSVPDVVLRQIIDFLSFKHQLSLSSVNSFWSNKLAFFRGTNLDYSKIFFLETTLFPSKVSFQKLLQVINCFTKYWGSLCQNSKDADFLNQRPRLEASLDQWLSANMEQITSPEWNTLLNKEGDTFSYILLQRLLLSPYFSFTIQHHIWQAMAIHNEIRIRASCDFLFQVPIILGKAAIHYIVSHTSGDISQLWQTAVKRGIDVEMYNFYDEFICTNVIHQEMNLFKKTHIEVRNLPYLVASDNFLGFENISMKAIEIGSLDIFKDGFISKEFKPCKSNKAIRENLISDGFELTYFCPYSGKETYTIPIVSFISIKNPHLLSSLFEKTLASQTPNQSKILMYLCSFIPKGFDFHQINIVAIVLILSPIISKFLPPNTLEDFYEVTKETQINAFKSIIKKEIDRLVSNWRKIYEKESYDCIEQELKSTALFFNAAPPILPFSNGQTQTEINMEDKIGLYFLTKIGYISDYNFSLVSCGRIISPDKFKLTFSPCQWRKLILPNGSIVNVFYQATQAEQVQKDGRDESNNDE